MAVPWAAGAATAPVIAAAAAAAAAAAVGGSNWLPVRPAAAAAADPGLKKVGGLHEVPTAGPPPMDCDGDPTAKAGLHALTKELATAPVGPQPWDHWAGCGWE